MPQVIKPVKTQVITKDGQCAVDISIELTININSDGLHVSATASPGVMQPVVTEHKKDEETLWAIPEFGSPNKVKFGKTEKTE